MPESRVPLPVSHDMEPAVLALNNAHAVELSLLDGARLGRLLSGAFYARRLGDVAAFLLAFDEGADYDSPNYLWFRERYPRFVYVDRIVVDPAMRKRGLAQLLYEDLFREACSASHRLIVCEVNSEPPNPASDRFHAALGFSVVGQAVLPGGAKSVRYLARALAPVTQEVR